MVEKETRYRHHPERIEKGLFMGSQQLDILGIHLMTLDAVLTSGSGDSGLSTTDWTPLKLSPLVVAAGETIPQDAIAVILDVAVNDEDISGATNGLLEFAPPEYEADGVSEPGIPTGHTETVYCADFNDRISSRLIIVEMSTDFNIVYKATASLVKTLDYTIKLIGWLIGGTRVARLAWPSVDLYCKFVI